MSEFGLCVIISEAVTLSRQDQSAQDIFFIFVSRPSEYPFVKEERGLFGMSGRYEKNFWNEKMDKMYSVNLMSEYYQTLVLN